MEQARVALRRLAVDNSDFEPGEKRTVAEIPSEV
jgi:hypothetical protein